jgi:hypothetical protein
MPLVPGAITGETVRDYLASFGNEYFQPFDIFIINRAGFIRAETAEPFSCRHKRIFLFLDDLFVLAKPFGLNFHFV